MRALIAAGGSGGHIFPGIALAEEIARRNGASVCFISSDKQLDIDILNKAGLDFETIPRNPYPDGRDPIRMIRFFLKLAGGIARSVKLIRRWRPDCVIGFGGFVSPPVIIAAWFMRVPRIIHEQNVVPGLANRATARFADRIAVSYEDTKAAFGKPNVIKVGNPVRRTVTGLDKARSRKKFGLDVDRFTLFIMGGSQGASSINMALTETVALMKHENKRRLQVIHITGEKDLDRVKADYRKKDIKAKVFSFLDEIETAYAASDLIVARAGATTIAEITCFGKPAILVPYRAKRVHQAENARFLSDREAAVTLDDRELDPERVRDIILGFLEEPDRLIKATENSRSLANPDAASRLAEEALFLAKGRDARE